MIKKILKRILPEKLIWKIGKLFPTKPFLSDIADTERIVEYAWALQNMPKSGRVLDVGCSGSMFAKMLASLGYDVTGADMRKINIEHPNFVPFLGDAKCIDGYGHFDIITCISTLEHTALVKGEEERLMQKLLFLLNPGGVILVTVPCGVPKMLNGYKVYGVNEFDNMESVEFFRRWKRGIWIKSKKKVVSKVVMNNKDEVKAIACVKISCQ